MEAKKEFRKAYDVILPLLAIYAATSMYLYYVSAVKTYVLHTNY